jgi:AbrB family looped-hinge helix DNA binding protein
MSKGSKIARIDSRGQIVIPKELRDKMKVSDGTGFFVYELSTDSILLKKIPDISVDLEKARQKMRRLKK